ncbi:MAG TPA: ABC transporter permease, partial [Ktedonobacteraceae bacterium]|nr:ABC transporter permease [Ktedonobacteraceae bacterium]
PYNYNLSDPGSIPNLFLQTLELVGTVMLISIIIAIPVGLLVARYKRLYLPIITVSALLYTIPSIAAFVLLIPITGFSPATAIIPLVLYNMLVLIRNTAAAVNGIDPLLIDVGRAMGMKRHQVLFRVTLPLALPVIVAGIRIATVTTIGISALAALVGQGGLGELIFQNIVSGDYNAVVAGAILIAFLAIVADLLLLALQTGLNRGRGALSVA